MGGPSHIWYWVTIFLYQIFSRRENFYPSLVVIILTSWRKKDGPSSPKKIGLQPRMITGVGFLLG
jgi:hypothetical protein